MLIAVSDQRKSIRKVIWWDLDQSGLSIKSQPVCMHSAQWMNPRPRQPSVAVFFFLFQPL